MIKIKKIILILLTVLSIPLIIINVKSIKSTRTWITESTNCFAQKTPVVENFTPLESSEDSPPTLKSNDNDQKIIPFYIYDFEQTNWYNACLNDYEWLDYKIRQNFEKKWYYHSDDFIFIRRIIDHNWRVFDPEHAEVFILPTLFSFYSGFGNHASGNPEKEMQENLKYGWLWNVQNLKCSGKSFRQMVDETTEFLINGSDTFRKYGNADDHDNYRTHLMVNSHFLMNSAQNRQLIFQNHTTFLNQILPNFSVGTFESLIHKKFTAFEKTKKAKHLKIQLDDVVEQKPAWRCSVIVPYVEAKWMRWEHSALDARLEQRGFAEWKERQYDLFFVGRMRTKMSYNTRRMVADSLERANELIEENAAKNGETGKSLTYIVTESYSPTIEYKKNMNIKSINDPPLPFCSESDCLKLKRCAYCQLTERIQPMHNSIGLNSKFALIVHGDTSTTSRLYDAIFNGLIPIIISPNLYQDGLPFQSKIPWRDISFSLQFSSLNDELDTEVIAKNIYNIVNFPEYLLEHKFRKLVSIRKEVSWLHPESRIVENILEDAKSQCIL